MSETQVERKPLYRCASSYFDLPIRMKGELEYSEAYRLCCEWNCWHDAKDMAYTERIDNDK